MTITIGSVFSGIGGFELGLERAIPQARTIWQVEQNSFCQSILRRHWPEATLHTDIRQVGSHNLAEVDILCGGFPCQDISLVGKQEGINGEQSGLWWEMHRLIGEIRPRIIVLENVAAIVSNGLSTVSESLAQLRYDLEWQIVSARQFGAPHIRRRWFGVAYSNSQLLSVQQKPRRQEKTQLEQSGKVQSAGQYDSPYSNSERSKKQHDRPKPVGQETLTQCGGSQAGWIPPENYWDQDPPKPTLCELDDGVPNRVARLRALGNAIVPQCSEYIGHRIRLSGLLETL
jgi:DNA (cytosine-5)-methyltransferase 1